MTDKEITKLIADLKRMRRELEQMAGHATDTSNRRLAQRWLATMFKLADYLSELRARREL